jgi:hypothetical protein
MHVLWGSPWQSGRQRPSVHVSLPLAACIQGSGSPAPFPVAYRGSASSAWVGSTHGHPDVRALVFPFLVWLLYPMPSKIPTTTMTPLPNERLGSSSPPDAYKILSEVLSTLSEICLFFSMVLCSSCQMPMTLRFSESQHDSHWALLVFLNAYRNNP